jgi:CopG family nickel-responsive transcriptional regulator
MSDLVRFGVSIEGGLLESFDRLVEQRGYATRSEALRDLMRDALVRAHVEERRGEVLGSLTLVYDHHARELAERLAERQHDSPEMIVSVLHVHLSHDDCMEVIVLRGEAHDVTALADSLLNLKGVKHGKLFLTAPERAVATDASLSDGHTAAHAHRH